MMLVTARSRAKVIGAALISITLLTGGVWRYGYVQALEPLAARGEADLALAADRLVTQLTRYRETAVLMSEHPTLAALGGGGASEAADALLLELVDKTSALMAFYTDVQGQVLASVLPEDMALPDGLPESDLFRRAVQGALGAAQAQALGVNRRAFLYAAPAFAENGGVDGVLVVGVAVDRLELEWRGAWPTVYFTDERGEIFVANRSEMLDWRVSDRGMHPADGTLLAINQRNLAGYQVWRQSLSPYIPARALHLTQDLPVIGLRASALVDVAPAQRLAGLQAAAVAALCLFFGSLLFVATERRRALAEANRLLEGRVRARTQDLSAANVALRREVSEREEAEAALRRTQAELVQAGKLSALGQMSAGISHELNQPLMAIRQFADNGAKFLERGQPGKAGENLTRIGDMATRAARIIRNLRAFVRNENEPVSKVDLGAVIDQAVELTQARLTDDAVDVEWVGPEGPVFVRGGEVRLTQVFVNLINNAADAMDGQDNKVIRIALTLGPPPRVTVHDQGPGIADPDRVFEPFYSTKQVGGGDGMGLGLSISYGLVQSFGGKIQGTNRPGGGACFAVELEPWQEAVGG